MSNFPFAYAVRMVESDVYEFHHLSEKLYHMAIGLFGNEEETWTHRVSGALYVYFVSNKRDLNRLCHFFEALNNSSFEPVNMKFKDRDL